MDYHPTVENLLFSNYIKYDRLYHLTQSALSHTGASNLDIYLDMNSLTKILYRRNDIMIKDDSSVTSSMINLCAHLREYFWSRHQVSTRIYIVYARNNIYNSEIEIPDYNSANRFNMESNIKVTDLINRNLELLKILCPYLPDVFFVYGEDYETAAVISYFINVVNTADKFPRLILTKDAYAWQLVATLPNTYIFRPYKTKTGIDESYCAVKKHFWETFRRDINPPQIPAGFCCSIMALSGLKERSIKALVPIGKAGSILFDVIKKYYMGNIEIPTDIVTLSKYVEKETEGSISALAFLNRYNLMDLGMASALFAASPKSVVSLSGIQNLYDPEAVKEINNKYFVSNPLDLNRI